MTKSKNSRDANKSNSDNINRIKTPTNKFFLWSMNQAPTLDKQSKPSFGYLQLVPAIIFTAVIIMITRMHAYERPMDQFYWSGGNNQLTDFFSYFKMSAILICAIWALIVILYRIFCQSLFIKRTYAYLPMAIYVVFVLLSYILSDYKEFALWGWNDRFEGTLTLIAYMTMLFFIINSINTEKDVKLIIYPAAVTSGILGILGLSQGIGGDFFQTVFGKKLITPTWYWDQVDNLNFTFQNNEIYQTVYNINYVSFYLTLIIPLFGMLFIRESSVKKKVAWGALFTLLLYNLIGSASSGGILGMVVVILVAVIVLNKRILQWKKSILLLLAITIVIGGVTYQRFMPELSGAINSVLNKQTANHEVNDTAINQPIRHKIDYIDTSGSAIYVGMEGNEFSINTYQDDPHSVKVSDATGNILSLTPSVDPSVYKIDDTRFDMCSLKAVNDSKGNPYLILYTDEQEWNFLITKEGPLYLNGMGKLLDLNKVPSVGWEDNQSFGSGRGYIWSRSIPLMMNTMLLGHGADTYCIYFPHHDYAGKYNSGTFSDNINIVVDKPHNMYMAAIIGTGGISMLALALLWGIYLAQSFLIYRKETYTSFISYAGVGIFLGICGFLVSGLVNDSTVSVMPMFYGLLGTGIAINLILVQQTKKSA